MDDQNESGHVHRDQLGVVRDLQELLPTDNRIPLEIRALGVGVGCLVGHLRFSRKRAGLLLDRIASGAKLGFSPSVSCEKYEERPGVLHFQMISELLEVSACWQPANPVTYVVNTEAA